MTSTVRTRLRRLADGVREFTGSATASGRPRCEYAAGDTDLPAADRDRFEDLPDGCGCAEVWEYLSEQDRRAGYGTPSGDD